MQVFNLILSLLGEHYQVQSFHTVYLFIFLHMITTEWPKTQVFIKLCVTLPCWGRRRAVCLKCRISFWPPLRWKGTSVLKKKKDVGDILDLCNIVDWKLSLSECDRVSKYGCIHRCVQRSKALYARLGLVPTARVYLSWECYVDIHT